MKASGLSGELRVGYQPAAILGEWTAEITHGSVVEARVNRVDSFWITQSPISLVLHVGEHQRFRWDGVQPQFSNGSLKIEVATRPRVVRE